MPVPLSPDQLQPAADMLSRAFASEPVHVALWPDPRRRIRGIVRLNRCVLRDGLRYGEVQAWSANLEALAVWMPPQRSLPGLLRLARSGFLALQLLEGPRFFRLSSRYVQTVQAMSRAHADEKNWYLQMLGVDPCQQRKGYGSRLLDAMLARLDQAGAGCCLETSSQENVIFYQRAGFRVADHRQVPGLEVPCWFMIRPERGKENGHAISRLPRGACGPAAGDSSHDGERAGV